MKTNKIILLVVLIIASSCSNNDYETIIRNKKYLLKKIKNTSLIHRNSYVTFTTNENSSVNRYYLRKEKDSFIFLRDDIEYSPNLFSDDSKQNYESIVCKVVEEYDQYIESLNIKDYTSSFSDCCGIDYKFYLEDGGVLLYVSDIRDVNGSYLNFLKGCEVVDKNWYYASEDW